MLVTISVKMMCGSCNRSHVLHLFESLSHFQYLFSYLGYYKAGLHIAIKKQTNFMCDHVMWRNKHIFGLPFSIYITSNWCIWRRPLEKLGSLRILFWKLSYLGFNERKLTLFLFRFYEEKEIRFLKLCVKCRYERKAFLSSTRNSPCFLCFCRIYRYILFIG